MPEGKGKLLIGDSYTENRPLIREPKPPVRFIQLTLLNGKITAFDLNQLGSLTEVSHRQGDGEIIVTRINCCKQDCLVKESIQEVFDILAEAGCHIYRNKNGHAKAVFIGDKNSKG